MTNNYIGRSKSPSMKNAENICLNCGFQLEDVAYCPSCGQRAHLHDLSFKFMIGHFFEAFINFDKKFFRSLRDIWVPNKINKEFLTGGRSIYVNHLRFFFLSLVIFFGLLTLNIKDKPFLQSDINEKAVLYKAKNEFDSIKVNFAEDCSIEILDSMERKLFSGDLHVNKAYMTIGGTSISHYDAYNLSIDSIYTKYKVEDTWQKLLFARAIKVNNDGGSALKFVIGNMLWGIILLSLIMALFLKLIYFRHHSYYIEHVFHMINYHCVAVLSISLVLICNLFMKIGVAPYLIMGFLSVLYLIYSLKSYYHQGWLKTIIKGIILFIGYVMATSAVAMLILFISIIIF